MSEKPVGTKAPEPKKKPPSKTDELIHRLSTQDRGVLVLND